MRKFVYGMLLCALILTGCQGASKKTDTPAATAHIVPPAYPAPGSGNAAQPAYPGPKGTKPTAKAVASNIYPGSGSSTGGTPVANPFAPAAGDEKLERGTATVDIKNSAVIVAESSPVQISIRLKGTMPNPCYRLRVNPAQPDAQKSIQVEVYSVLVPGEICAQVLQNFDETILLGSFPAGHYTVYVNGELLGEFEA
jgi:hypothetical protein